jgi:hypothetical protein
MNLEIVLCEGKQFGYLIEQGLEVGVIKLYHLRGIVRVLDPFLVLIGLHDDTGGRAEHQQEHVYVELLLF